MDFFNDLGKKLNEAAKNIAGWGRDENAPSDKLADEIKRAETNLKDSYARLGEACYQRLTGEGNTISEELIREVRQAKEKVERLNEQHRRETSRRRCPACGSIQEGDARFCSACGRPMITDAARARQEAEETCEYCPECGAAREHDATCCPICGKSFSEKEEEPAVIIKNDGDAPEEPDGEERYEE